MLRQTFPIQIEPQRPSLLRSEAAKRWAEQSTAIIEREEELVAAFEEAHDLSHAFSGFFGLPALWLFRAGEVVLVETAKSTWRIPFDIARAGLVQVGDEIADRFRGSGDKRWSALVDAWMHRDEGEPVTLLAWATSLPRAVASQLVSDGILPSLANVSEAANDDDEIRIAARVASALPEEQIRQILRLVGTFQARPSQRLDDLSRLIRTHVDTYFGDRRAFEQGEAAANTVRDYFVFQSEQALDIFQLVQNLGITLQLREVEPQTLDGLAIWGKKHGPAILLNLNSKRVSNPAEFRRTAAARVTLAHELCHLLLDRGHALSAIDILNSRMPADFERRARAFAGELLLPARAAAEAWLQRDRPQTSGDLNRLLNSLSTRYGVPRSVAAWKLEHGVQPHNVEIWHTLDSIVPNR